MARASQPFEMTFKVNQGQRSEEECTREQQLWTGNQTAKGIPVEPSTITSLIFKNFFFIFQFHCFLRIVSFFKFYCELCKT